MDQALSIIILCAGKGTRMKSSLPKVMHKIAGRRMIDMVIDEAIKLDPKNITLVISQDILAHRQEIIDNHKSKIKLDFVVQENRLGTANAVDCGLKYLKNSSQEILINELFLNAPDYEAQGFKSIVSNIKKITNHITIYCSTNDKAMIASKIFNKNDRLGACANIDEIDVINVSGIDDSSMGLGHGYYSSRSIIGDMFLTLIGIDVKQRLFIVKSSKLQSEKYILRK